ncbi:hypothetical protein DRJ19_05600 [Candidatus Woesearchaeota archaeon]|nr:MAG: hypothetical protein DRJ19_05600 [Candidatus Woesearchaeota archaeon]
MKWKVTISGPLEKEPILREFARELEKYFDVEVDVNVYYKMIIVRLNGLKIIARPHIMINSADQLRALFWPFFKRYKHTIRQRIREKRRF